MEEAVGAEIYLTESSSPPIQYPLVNSITICSALGGTFALGVAALVTNYNFNWRWAFFAGTVIALAGTIARSTLRETPDFIEAKRKQNKILAKLNDREDKKEVVEKKEKIYKKTMLYYFLIQCARPVLFYFSYVYSIDILKGSFHCSTDYIVVYLFYLALVDLVGIIVPTYLSYRIDPLKILKVKTYIFGTFILFFPYLLTKASSPLELFYIQSFFVLFRIDSSPAAPIFYSHFPVLKRFTYAGVMYAVSRALLYIVTSYGFVVLIKYLGYGGMLVIMLPTIIGFYFSIRYFQKLNKEREVSCIL
jgi:MFS family permease